MRRGALLVASVLAITLINGCAIGANDNSGSTGESQPKSAPTVASSDYGTPSSYAPDRAPCLVGAWTEEEDSGMHRAWTFTSDGDYTYQTLSPLFPEAGIQTETGTWSTAGDYIYFEMTSPEIKSTSNMWTCSGSSAIIGATKYRRN